MSHCKQCPLGKVGMSVIERGPKDAKLIVVGEAPGSTELMEGKPFVGPSGKLLTESLVKAGLGEFPIYYTNAIMCKPDCSPPSNEYIKACQGQLIDRLYGREDAVILALGNTAIRSIMNDMSLKITKIRGTQYDTIFGRVIPTFHPAAILRNPGDYRLFMRDIHSVAQLVLGESNTSALSEPTINMLSERTKSQFVGEIDEAREIAADLETTGLDVVSGSIRYMGICFQPGRVWIIPPEHLSVVKPFIEDKYLRWIWHNGKFDVQWLRKQGIYARVDADTMLMHYAIYEQRGIHDLGQLARDYLGAEEYKISRPDIAPDAELIPYLAKDVDYTLRIYRSLEDELASQSGPENVYSKILIPASDMLANVESRGMRVDFSHLDSLQSELTVGINSLTERIQAMAEPYWNPKLYVSQSGAKKEPSRFNPDSVQQLKWMITKQMRIPLLENNTRKENLSEANNEFINAILERRTLKKRLSTYVIGIREATRADGKVHPSFLLHGTVTGRLSSSGPNMQNIPRESKYKNTFIPEPGNCFVEIDFSQIELRVMAYLARDPFFTDVYMNGRDLHSEMATKLFGEGFTSEQRTRAKTLNFSIAYGITPSGIAAKFGISFEEAAQMIRDWFANVPAIERYMAHQQQKVLAGKPLQTIFGRTRYYGPVTEATKGAILREAGNFAVQSVASDLTLITALNLQEVAPIVNLVHDSITFEVPKERSERIARQIKAIAESVPPKILKSQIPFPVGVKVMDRWN